MPSRDNPRSHSEAVEGQEFGACVTPKDYELMCAELDRLGKRFDEALERHIDRMHDESVRALERMLGEAS